MYELRGFLAVTTKVIEILAILMFCLALGVLCLTLLVKLICVQVGFTSVCELASTTWGLVNWNYVAIATSISLFFVASLVRYCLFDRWHDDFIEDFKVDDELITAMVTADRSVLRSTDDVAKTIYKRYRLIQPIIGAGRTGVALNLFVPIAIVVVAAVLYVVDMCL